MRILLGKFSLKNMGDCILSITSLIQFVLSPLQILLMDSGMMSEEGAGKIRVLGSAFFVFCSIFWILKRKALLTIGVFSLMLLLFYMSAIMNEANIEYIMAEGIRFTLCISIPIFLSFVSIRNLNIFFQIARYLSLFIAFIGVIYVAMLFTGNLPMKENVYDMALGYALMFPALYLLYCHKAVYTIIAALLTFIILLIGSRGPLLPIALFVIVQRFFFGTAKERILLTVVILIGIVLFASMIAYLQELGIYSRTLMYIEEGIASSDSGRGDIYDNIIAKIQDRPLLGYGVFADRVFVNGVYCHNILLEIFIDFGCLLPLLLIFLLGIYYVRILKYTSSIETLFFLLLLLASFIPLLVSSSYLIDFRLPLFVGYMYVLSNKYLPIKVKSVCKTN